MAARGKFIVIEGIDGSGKRTQIELLVRALEAKGVAVAQIGFPNYEQFFGKLVGQFLNGEFGALEDVDPHFSAMLYAGDRLQAAPGIRADLDARRSCVCGGNDAVATNIIVRAERCSGGRGRDEHASAARGCPAIHATSVLPHSKQGATGYANLDLEYAAPQWNTGEISRGAHNTCAGEEANSGSSVRARIRCRAGACATVCNINEPAEVCRSGGR